MQPAQLFEKHQQDAIKVADGLVYKFHSVGALPYRLDIRNEALTGLWQACTRFDPTKQTLKSDLSFWGVLFAGKEPKIPAPYDYFWGWARMRVDGSCRDFLRKEGVITRIDEDSQKGTMVLSDRLVSLDSSIDSKSYNRDLEYDYLMPDVSYAECFESKDRADCYIEDEIRFERLSEMVKVATLPDLDTRVVMLRYSPPGMEVEDIATAMQQPLSWVKKTLKLSLLRVCEFHLASA